MLSAGVYGHYSSVASDKRFLRLGWGSAPYCRAYHCVHIPTISGDIWDDRDILCNPCPKSSQLWRLLLAAYGLLCFGVFCLAGGIRYGLPVWLYSDNVIFSVVAGVLILTFRKKAIRANSA